MQSSTHRLPVVERRARPAGQAALAAARAAIAVRSGKEVWLLPASREDGLIAQEELAGFFVRGLLRLAT